MQEEALAIFATGVDNQIRLEPEWITREENEFADYLSRVFDYDDWMLNPAVFQELEVMWGPHTINRFTDVHNSSWRDSIYAIRAQRQKQLMPSLVIGAMITIGGALPYI